MKINHKPSQFYLDFYLWIFFTLLSSILIVESLEQQKFGTDFHTDVRVDLNPQEQIIKSISKLQIRNITNKTKSHQFYQKGKRLFRQQKYEEAIKYYQKSIQFNPNHKQSYFGVQNALFWLVRVYRKELRCYKLFPLREKVKQITTINRLYNIQIDWIARSCIIKFNQNIIKNKIQKIALFVLQKGKYFQKQQEDQIKQNETNKISLSNQNIGFTFTSNQNNFSSKPSLQDIINNVFAQVTIDFDYVSSEDFFYNYWKLKPYVITQQNVLMALGDYFYKNLHLPIAEIIYQTALKNSQNSAPFCIKLGKLLKLQGKLEQSQTLYQKSIQNYINNTQVVKEYIQLFLITQDYNRAKQILKKTIQVNFKNLQLYDLLQNVQKYQNHIENKQTINALTSAIQKDQNWKEGILKLSEIYQQKGQFKLAIDLLTKNIENQCNKLDNQTLILKKLKSLISKSKNLKLAQELLNESVQQSQSLDKQFYLYLGWKFKHLRVLNESKEIYKKTLEIHPLNVVALHNIGNLNYQMKNYHEAIKYYSKLLYVQEYPILYLRNLTICLLKLIQLPNKINSTDNLNLTKIWEKVIKVFYNKNMCFNDHYQIFMNSFDKPCQTYGRNSKAIEKYESITNYQQMFFYNIKQTLIEIQDLIDIIEKFYFNGKYKEDFDQLILKFQKSIIQNPDKSEQVKIQLLKKISQVKRDHKDFLNKKIKQKNGDENYKLQNKLQN